jgi:hypothetical protein
VPETLTISFVFSRLCVKLITIAVVSAGCERPSPSESGRAASSPPVACVEVVGPERRTVERTVGEPG